MSLPLLQRIVSNTFGIVFFSAVSRAKRYKGNNAKSIGDYAFKEQRDTARDKNKTSTCARMSRLTPLAEPVVSLCIIPERVNI